MRGLGARVSPAARGSGAAQNQLGEAWGGVAPMGTEAASLAGLVSESVGAPAARHGLGTGPSCAPEGGPGGSARVHVGCGVGRRPPGPPDPPGLSCASRALRLLPYPHLTSALCQEAAPELAVRSRRLREQLRKTGTGQSRWWGCQEEPGMPGQHLSGHLPGSQATPHTDPAPASSPLPHAPSAHLPGRAQPEGAAPWSRSRSAEPRAQAQPRLSRHITLAGEGAERRGH